jgi:glycosyltransferase involved in cell wall biosynthesis
MAVRLLWTANLITRDSRMLSAGTTKPCLIFSNYELKLTDGGPSGFLAQNLVGTSSAYYHLGTADHPSRRTFWQAALRHLRGGRDTIPPSLRANKSPYFLSRALRTRTIFERENAAGYPFIWFHDVFAFAACEDLLPPSQKVILQSHSPQLPSEEIAAAPRSTPGDIEWVERAQARAFARADVCVFPNADSARIYESLLTERNELRYVMSGCRPMTPRYDLPLDPAYIYYLYIGRRVHIKGFDIVLEAFKQIYDTDAAVKLLLLGSGDVVQHPGIIDVGHVTDPASWLAACDYMISANVQSYFDLAVMEALSLGTPIILTCTGGHRDFMNAQSAGIIPVREADPQLLAASMLANRTKRLQNAARCDANRKLYSDSYSDAKYRERLDLFLSDLTRDGHTRRIA